MVILGMTISTVAWGSSFYRTNTFDEGWRLVEMRGQTLTVEVITSACAWIHSPSVVESPGAVEIQVRWTQQPVPCSGSAVASTVDVTLEEPLGGRTLLGCQGAEYNPGPPCRRS